jgi:hypothetical protein
VTSLARWAGIAALLAVGACRRGDSSATDTTVAGGVQSPVVIGVGGKPDCPGTGHWTPCAVRKRLDAAGVAPQTASELPDLPKLDVAPVLYTVGRSGLAVYLFADSSARARAAAALDTVHFIPASKELTMHGETTAIQNDNLLALLFSRMEQQRERVSDALLAGPPQPEKP